MLYQKLREVTQPLHDASMQHPFMAALMNGGVEPGAFYDYLGQLKPIYDELEATDLLNHLPFYDERLHRYPVIVDALYLSGGYISPLAETHKYVMHLMNIVNAKDTTLLVAHHYARYMGDLAAGPMFNFISSNLGVDTKYLRFYDFSSIGDPGAIYEYRKHYGELLDTHIPETEHDRFIAEVVTIFDMTSKILTALARTWVM